MSRVQGVLLGGGALLVLAGAAMLAGPGVASGQGVASLKIAPPSQNITQNTNTFFLEVKAENVSNLGAYEFTITFDPAIIEFVGAKDDGYLASTGRQQQCFGFGLTPDAMNTFKALHLGCSTNGLVAGNTGTAGPSGSGVLATIAFKPVKLGTANLVFVGRGQELYYVGAPDPTKPEGAVELGHTALTAVEVCPTGEAASCYTTDIEFEDNTGVVAIIDQAAATPTALPPTPTPKPRKTVEKSEFQATVAAAVGTPRVLGTPGTGTLAGDPGTGGTGAGADTGIGASGTGSGVAGSSAGGGAGGRNGELPEGVTIGPDGIPRGPDGVPIAGYGPQPRETNPLWIRLGIVMLIAGALALAAGASRRARVRA
ncbi:MAG: hypothetical protein HY873_12435 [Chloroflexi bacterium]|nr:hypothetical protein [Chloroflexota bacterium]